MNPKEKETRILTSLQRATVQHPIRTLFCASTIYDGAKTFYTLPEAELEPYMNEAFDILCRLEEEKIVQNLSRLPGQMTLSNKPEYIAASQWILRKRDDA